MAKFTDYTASVFAAVYDGIEKALVEIGEPAAGCAVQHITQQQAADTGLLRNSITYSQENGPRRRYGK